MNYYKDNNIVNELILYNKGVRDDSDINVYRDLVTNAFVLDKIKLQNYENKGINYWNCNNIYEARKKTFDDDNRRYNQLNNINYNNLLDFGCGNGGLMKIIKDNNKNKNIIGLELNNEIRSYLNKESFQVFSNIDDIPKNYNFDCIMLNHVLEHLYDPINTLKSIKNKMYKDTLLIIEVPHANDILINDYNCDKFKKFTFWSEHLILHTEKTLKKLLNISGFYNIKITYYQRYNIFNHLKWLVDGKPGGHKETKYNDCKLIESYNNFLITNKKTDTLIAYCYI